MLPELTVRDQLLDQEDPGHCGHPTQGNKVKTILSRNVAKTWRRAKQWTDLAVLPGWAISYVDIYLASCGRNSEEAHQTTLRTCTRYKQGPIVSHQLPTLHQVNLEILRFNEVL
ncbi:uncharacterized protein RBU33_029183 [Hipposideros larvatus]